MEERRPPDLAEKFERKFVEYSVAETLKRGGTKREFAAAVFKDRSMPERALQAVEKGGHPSMKTKPQRLTLAEAWRAAEFLGYDFPSYVVLIRGEMFRAGDLQPAQPEKKVLS